MMNKDLQDLLEYVSHGNEQAFRRIVERHSSMVHGVAYRMTRDKSLAEEITQSVFILLARKAPVASSERLAGWLHRATTGESRNAIRKEGRRSRLHQQYLETMNEIRPPDVNWDDVAPHLDSAVAALSKDGRRPAFSSVP